MALSAGSASAIDVWTGGTSSDWMDGSNWDLGVPPTPTETVNFGLSGVTPPNHAVLGVGGPVSVSVGSMSIGASGTLPGILTIQNGSSLTTSGVSSVRLGVGVGSTGIVTVTGPGSQFNITTGTFGVGFGGTGILNIEDGAAVVTGSGTILGNGAASSGTLNISGGGTLETDSLRSVNSASQVNFNNGILRAGAGGATFISAFSGTELNLLAGGLTIDTNGFTIGTDATSGFTGTGGLTITGGTVFGLQANSTYAGETRIEAGSGLSLSGVGAIANSSRVIADGSFDVSASMG